MDDVFVGSLMSTPVHSVSPDASVREAAQSMQDYEIGSLVVVDDEPVVVVIVTTTARRPTSRTFANRVHPPAFRTSSGHGRRFSG